MQLGEGMVLGRGAMSYTSMRNRKLRDGGQTRCELNETWSAFLSIPEAAPTMSLREGADGDGCLSTGRSILIQRRLRTAAEGVRAASCHDSDYVARWKRLSEVRSRRMGVPRWLFGRWDDRHTSAGPTTTGSAFTHTPRLPTPAPWNMRTFGRQPMCDNVVQEVVAIIVLVC